MSAALLQQLDAKCERQFAELKAALRRQHNPAPEKRKEYGTHRESGSARAEHSQAHEQDHGKQPVNKKAKPDGLQGPE